MAHSDLISYAAMRSILAGLGFAPDGSSSSPSGAHLLVYGKAPGGAFAVAYLPTRKRGRAWVETYTREGGPSGYVYRVTRNATTGEWGAT